MTTDPNSSSIQEARRALGARLRQLRKSAGLTGRAIAEATGQHVTRVSRVENGVQPPTEQQIRDWCDACSAEDQILELIATARTVDSAYQDWVRVSREGMRRLGGTHTIASYRRTRTFRVHEPLVMPGFFQTETYFRRILPFWYKFLDAPEDTEATVASRLARTAAALSPDKRIAVVLGEQAIRTHRGSAEEHVEQLTHLLSVMRLPFVSVGIIPADARRYAIATIGFWIFDSNAVVLETPTAAIKVTRPDEIAQYVKLFELLQAEAIYGQDARQLIADVVADL
ncbi:MAG: helix-turn-helix domain-containing protein [Micromonosporaceae bacterium]